jgi:hypothetical protein
MDTIKYSPTKLLSLLIVIKGSSKSIDIDIAKHKLNVVGNILFTPAYFMHEHGIKVDDEYSVVMIDDNIDHIKLVTTSTQLQYLVMTEKGHDINTIVKVSVVEETNDVEFTEGHLYDSPITYDTLVEVEPSRDLSDK